MQIILAKTAGFCFGVNRAVKLTYELLEQGRPVATLGPLIHNPQVVEDLESKGAITCDSVDDVPDGCEVVIRSHGVGQSVYDKISTRRLVYHDATCPFVKKIHRIVEKQTAEGRRVIIIGSPEHPEVQGIRGWGNDTTLVVEKPEQIDDLLLSKEEKLCIVSQTTFNYKKFQDLVEKFEKKGYDILVLNTICNATQERQVEARRIASEVDAMIVIGGKHSSNTQKLYEICQKECKNTYFIQSLGDFNPECVNSVRSVGITAGASTPNQIIEEVHTNVRIKF